MRTIFIFIIVIIIDISISILFCAQLDVIIVITLLICVRCIGPLFINVLGPGHVYHISISHCIILYCI